MVKLKLIRRIAILLFLFLIILVCWLVNPFQFINRIIENATATPTLTPTHEYCYWNWSYDEGSPEFNAAIQDGIALNNIQGTVRSTKFGEIYSCDNSFAALSLDVVVEIRDLDLDDPVGIATVRDRILTLLAEKLPISGVSTLGNVELIFITGENSITCFWDFERRQCRP